MSSYRRPCIGLRPGITERHLVRLRLNPSMPLPRFARVNDLETCSECAEESQALERRRRKEASELAALDTTEISPGRHWYVISQNWLSQWLRFRSGGDVIPGPIDNSDLLLPSDDSPPRPRPGLVRGRHYRGVNEAVWMYLFKSLRRWSRHPQNSPSTFTAILPPANIHNKSLMD